MFEEKRGREIRRRLEVTRLNVEGKDIMDFTEEARWKWPVSDGMGRNLHIYVFNNGVCGLGEHRALRYLQIFIRI